MLQLEGHPSPVTALAFAPDGERLAAGQKDGSAWVWDAALEPNVVRGNALPPDDPANAVEWSADGRTLLLAARGGWMVHQWRDDGGLNFTAPNLKESTTAVRFVGPDLVAVGYGHRAKPEAGRLELFDLAAWKRKEPHFLAPHGVRAVAAHPPSKLVAWSEWGGEWHNGPRIMAWDVTKADPLRIPLAQSSPSVAIHPDGTLLAYAAEWGFKLFDLAAKRERLSVRGHKGTVTGVAFSPDGRHVVTGSWDGTVRLWDAATGAERGSFRWPVGKVFAVAYSPDGLRLAAGGDGGKVVVWDTE